MLQLLQVFVFLLLSLSCSPQVLAASRAKSRRHVVAQKKNRPKEKIVEIRKTKAKRDNGMPFLETTRLKGKIDYTPGGTGTKFLKRLGRRTHKTLVDSQMFRFVVEGKIFESVMGMVMWKVATNMSKEKHAVKRARRLFTLYACLYIGALLLIRTRVMEADDRRIVKISGLPPALTSMMNMIKKMQKGQQQAQGLEAAKLQVKDREVSYRDYDLGEIKAAFNRFSFFLVGMTLLHFKWKNLLLIMYWGIHGPLMMLREPLFQIYLLGMEESGIRERPWGPKEPSASTPEKEEETLVDQSLKSVKPMVEVVKMETNAAKRQKGKSGEGEEQGGAADIQQEDDELAHDAVEEGDSEDGGEGQLITDDAEEDQDVHVEEMEDLEAEEEDEEAFDAEERTVEFDKHAEEDSMADTVKRRSDPSVPDKVIIQGGEEKEEEIPSGVPGTLRVTRQPGD